MSAPVLSLETVDKRYAGVHALKSVSMEIRPNEVVGLIGENGAGKSTLMRILSGVAQPDGGRMFVSGKPVRFADAVDARRHGIAMVFQEQSLLPNLSVGENIYLGNERQFSRGGLINWRKLHAAARRQLAKVNLDLDPHTPTQDVDFATRQMVELAKALTLEEATEGDLVILLDEPTAVLEPKEIETLFQRVRALKSRASFVFVSHRLDEVLGISDRVYVMKDGEAVAELPARDADVSSLYRLMVGRTQSSEHYREELQKPVGQDLLLRAEKLSCGPFYRDVSFELREGEVLGIAGVIGSGREELTRTLAGFAPHTGGRLFRGRDEVKLKEPADAVARGIGYVPRERRVEGVVMFLPVAANMSLVRLGRFARYGLLDLAQERRVAEDWVRRLRIKAGSIDTLCLNLSGGNQQKVVLAKWLDAGVRVLILDHPSRGLDVGAKEEVYDFIRAVTAEGLGVILTSDTLDETIGLSHRILVMKDGTITHESEAAPGAKPEQVDLIKHMV